MTGDSDSHPTGPGSCSGSSALRDFACGAVSGACCRLLTHPLDTIKTNSFVSEAPNPGARAPGLRAVVRSLWHTERSRAFYRGAGIATLGAVPGNALYLGGYEAFKAALTGWLAAPEAPGSGALLLPAIHLASGLGAEAVSCLVWVPVDVSKERLQSQSPSVPGRYRSSCHALVTIARLEGAAGLYRGYWSTLASFGPFSAVYFCCYELAASALGLTPDTPPRNAFIWALAAALLANATAAIVTNPLELVKTRLQVQRACLESGGGPFIHRPYSYQYAGLRDGLRQLWLHEGLRGLCQGAPARVLHTAPNAALTMAAFRWLQANTTT